MESKYDIQGSAQVASFPYQVPREIEHPLHPLRVLQTNVLVWVQPHLMRAAYELWAENKVVATLRYKGYANRRALAASTDGIWTFEDLGGVCNRIRITQLGRVVGTLIREDGLCDTFTLESGQVFLWIRQHPLRNEWAFFDQGGNRLLQFSPEKSKTARSRVYLSRGANLRPESSLLTLLGLYLTLNGHTPNGTKQQIGCGA